MFADDTIAAISTPPGEGALAVVRVSGPDAFRIAAKIFRSHAGSPFAARRVHVGLIVDDSGTALDEVVLTAFTGPASYTGEDVIEISGHGGAVVSAGVLKQVLGSGARAAGPGEFTQRAFLNGKIDLTQAEAVMDLIRAQTPLAAKAAARQLEGAIGAEARTIADGILNVIAHLEAYIDFPDEDIDPEVGDSMVQSVRMIRDRVSSLLATAAEGRILRDGVRLAICGRPNAGKSSLLNRLAGYDRAIVSPVAGTTRDTIEEWISLRGIPFQIVDTAGIRETSDPIEREGVSRALRAVSSADVVVRVLDASDPASHGDDAAASGEILVLNKCDLLAPDAPEILPSALRISCTAGLGVDALVDRLVNRVRNGQSGDTPGGAAINARHQACLVRVESALSDAQSALECGAEPELTAIELRLALEAAGEIVGRLDTEDILDRIFGTFCLGK